MKTKTIEAIAKRCERVDRLIRDFDPRKIDEKSSFGEEGEYSAQALKAGIRALMSDIRGLVNAHNKFVSLSTYKERVEIVGSLDKLLNSLAKKDYPETVARLDELKTLIRVYHPRSSSETRHILEQRANRLNALLEEVEVHSRNAHARLGDQEKAMEELVGNMQRHMADTQSFFEEVGERQKQLEAQKVSTENYEEKLRAYAATLEEHTQNADSLIKEARNALEYTTAVGVSASFIERHNEYKESRSGGWWIFGAVVFLLAVAAFGVFMVSKEGDLTFAVVLFRFAVVSALFTGAYFCAAQYNKQKNVQEDYGYKAVLAKSMMAFLERLPGHVQGGYLAKVLNEIHKDPLRKRHEVQDFMGDSLMDKIRMIGRTKKREDAETHESQRSKTT